MQIDIPIHAKHAFIIVNILLQTFILCLLYLHLDQMLELVSKSDPITSLIMNSIVP